MIWLIIHDWLLLLLAFLLGLLIGWWIWHRRTIEDNRDAYAESLPLNSAPEPVKTPVQNLAEMPSAVAAPPEPVQSAETAAKIMPLAATQTGTTSTNDPGVAPKLYTSASDGPADDLKKIKGIGPNYEKLLNEIGIYYYRQISDWTTEEIKWLDNKLEFPGRIVRDKWQEQASTLHGGGSTDFASRYDKGTTPSSYQGNGADRTKERPITAENYIDDVRKYDPTADKDIVQKIVTHCGIALQSRDASLVACSDKKEREQVEDGFCAKKLGLPKADAVEAVQEVCQQMSADRNKKRVTFYYLLAKKTGKLNAL